MTLLSKVHIKYTETPTDLINLNREEWIHMLDTFFTKLASKQTGKIMTDRLNYFLSSGYKITIMNRDITCSVIFPKIHFNRKSVEIVIPSVPYFTSIDVIDASLCEDTHMRDIYNVSLGLPANKILNLDKFNFLISQEDQPLFISFAHELVHCLRFFEGYDMSDSNEESNTIYGIKSTVLSYDNSPITENAIRTEWEMKARVTHNAKEIFCYGLRSSYQNASRFTKNSYLL